jgi:hypothetical protein
MMYLNKLSCGQDIIGRGFKRQLLEPSLVKLITDKYFELNACDVSGGVDEVAIRDGK